MKFEFRLIKTGDVVLRFADIKATNLHTAAKRFLSGWKPSQGKWCQSGDNAVKLKKDEYVTLAIRRIE